MLHYISKKHKRKKHLKDLKKYVKHRLHADDDIMPEKLKLKLAGVGEQLAEIDYKDPKSVDKLNSFEEKIGQLLPSKKHRVIREWVDVLAVALAVAFGIRGLFLQPFKIPTSSMQPTLYGIHYISQSKILEHTPELLLYPLFSARKADLTVTEGGVFDPASIHSFSRYLIFDYTSFNIGSKKYTLPGAPEKVLQYCKIWQYFGIDSDTNQVGLRPGIELEFKAGDKVVNGWLSLGDHLFVDRVSYHLRGLRRGDVTVFYTEGLVNPDGSLLISTGPYYIKRLVGLPGDTLKIVDGTLFVKPKGTDEFKPITEFDERFKKVYSGKGGYQGHLSETAGGQSHFLATSNDTLTVPDDHYFMLGDNSSFSSDGRFWGTVPRRNIVGTAAFVFWPFSRRWGIIDNKAPVDVPTGKPGPFTFDSMGLQ